MKNLADYINEHAQVNEAATSKTITFNFAGLDKVYMRIDRIENEEAFYLYERNGLRKQPCFHVYFEKREELEDYIFGTGFVPAEEEPKVEISEGGKYGIALNNLRNQKNNSVNNKSFLA